MVTAVTSEEFKNIIGNSDSLVVADFSASWCIPCRSLKTTMEELSETYKEFKFINCDAEECSDLTEEYFIINVPTVILFKDGKIIDRFTGAMSKPKIIEKLESLQ